MLAVFFYGEPFTRAHGAAFGLIWCALVLYTVDAVRTSGGRRVAAD
jgi:chloramphenicol-sensitive protein RarD